MQQCGSLLITELKLWLLCKSWWQGKISLWSGGLFLLSLTHGGLSAYINYNAPQCYFSYNTSYYKTGYVQFQYQSITWAKRLKYPLLPSTWKLSLTDMWLYNSQWNEVKDVLTGFIGSSGYPTVCGNYGICTSYFRLINDKLPNHGYAPYLLLTNYPPDVNVRICERNSVLH